MKNKEKIYDKSRARLEILNHVVGFGSALRFDISDRKSFYSPSSFFVTMEPPNIVLNSLIRLQSAPTSKWYLGWLVEYIPTSSGYDDTYVIESLEDGQLCNWTNVSINRYVYYYDYDGKEEPYPQRWRWTDKQFEFNKRWKRIEDYSPRALDPVFEGDKVTLRLRARWQSEILAEKTFDNWRRVTKKMMKEFYDESSKKS